MESKEKKYVICRIYKNGIDRYFVGLFNWGKTYNYLVGFFNIGNFYKLYVPLYKYTDGEKSFSYYVNGKEISIFN